MDIAMQGRAVWLTGFWGFGPEEEGYLGFSKERDRDRLFGMIAERQLVCVYGAASKQTAPRDVGRLLGLLEVERTKVVREDRQSAEATKGAAQDGTAHKWRFAFPVRRAWRTTRELPVKHVFPRSYSPDSGTYISRFGTWLNLEEARWLLTEVPFREASVWGEESVPDGPERRMTEHLSPSHAVLGAFGIRTVETRDRRHLLYLARFTPKAAEMAAGQRVPRGSSVWKIGITGSLKNRLRALNLSFPKTASLGWTIERTAPFPDRAGAVAAEDRFKHEAARLGQSLGREHFVIEDASASALFTKLSPVSGLTIRA